MAAAEPGRYVVIGLGGIGSWLARLLAANAAVAIAMLSTFYAWRTATLDREET